MSSLCEVIRNELWLYLVPAALAVLLLALFLEEVGFFLRHVPSSRRRCLSLWILGMYPVKQPHVMGHHQSVDGFVILYALEA